MYVTSQSRDMEALLVSLEPQRSQVEGSRGSWWGAYEEEVIDRSRGSRSKTVSRYRGGEIPPREIDALQDGLSCRELVAFFVGFEVIFAELQLGKWK